MTEVQDMLGSLALKVPCTLSMGLLTEKKPLPLYILTVVTKPAFPPAVWSPEEVTAERTLSPRARPSSLAGLPGAQQEALPSSGGPVMPTPVVTSLHGSYRFQASL